MREPEEAPIPDGSRSTGRRATGLGWVRLLRPKALAGLHSLRPREAGGSSWAVTLAAVAVAWPVAFWIVRRFLQSVREMPEIGVPLAGKMLGLALLLLLGILLVSNLIGALSSFFLARDLPGLLAAPVDWLDLYGARLTETLFSSSWMVVLLLVPVLAAYGAEYDGSWGYVAVAAAAIPPLLVIPTVVGIAFTLLLVRVFPARRARDILGMGAVLAASLVVAALRVLRPERLVNPQGFRSLVDFLQMLRAPTSPWLPSDWAADAMMGSLRGSLDPFYLLLLWSTAGGLFVLGADLHRRLYPRCFTRAQESVDRGARNPALWGWIRRGLGFLDPRRLDLVMKDLRVFFRDVTQWSQLLILGVLVVVYVYNMRVLPVSTDSALGGWVMSLVVYLNVTLAGFVLAAVAARFVYPAVSLEGRTLWLLRSSPLSVRDLVWSKYWTGAAPLLVLAAVLTAVTNWFLGVPAWMMGLSLLTVTALTLAFAGQALAWGAAYPKFEAANAAQIPTSVGGLLFMFGALANLGVVVGLQVWAMRGYLETGLAPGAGRPPGALEVASAAVLTLAVCWPAGVLPYRFARRRVERLEVP